MMKKKEEKWKNMVKTMGETCEKKKTKKKEQWFKKIRGKRVGKRGKRKVGNGRKMGETMGEKLGRHWEEKRANN